MKEFDSIQYPSDKCDGASLADQITLLAGQINAGNHQLLRLITEFDECKGWSGGGTVRSCAHWLNWKCGIALGAAREKVRVAHALEALPQINTAFGNGEISYSMARAMTRVAVPENEDYLLMIARHGTASHMEKLVGQFRRVQRADGNEAEREREALRRLAYYQDDEGMWVIQARLPPEEGSLVVKAIEAVAAPIQKERQDQLQSMPQSVTPSGPGKISAEIFPGKEEGAASFGELVAHTRADALVTVAEHFLASCSDSEPYQALKGSERCQTVLHVDIDTLRRHAEQAGQGSNGGACCHLDEKPWISPDTARRLSCDASLVTVLEDGNGHVLNVGRRSRTIPGHIRRALAIRDKTCCVPGCTEFRYVDAHHIVHWADGGETSLQNLATLCRHHHRELHRGSFTLRAELPSNLHAQSTLVFETPSGDRLETSFPQFPLEVALTGRAALAEAAPEVDMKTCVPHWLGERCDYGMAVDGLLRRGSGGCDGRLSKI